MAHTSPTNSPASKMLDRQVEGLRARALEGRMI